MHRRSLLAFVLVASLVMTLGRAARADEHRAEETNRAWWYGWQTLIVDGAAVSMVIAGADASPSVREGWWTTAVATYLMGPSMVHLGHQSPAKAAVAFAVRLLAPIAGAMLACAGGCDVVRYGGGGGSDLAAGMTFGYAAAVTIDVGVLARERR